MPIPRILFGLIFGLAARAVAGPGSISDGFEEPSLNPMWRTDKLAARAFELQSEIVRSGKRAIRITIQEGDPSPEVAVNGTERDELQEPNQARAREGDEVEYRFSLFIPRD